MGEPGPFQDTTNLRVENLSLARGGRTLFDAMSFAAAAGDYVELRGANGAGKTSLLRALAGFLPPRSGRIVFEGAADAMLALHFVGHLNGLKSAASVHSHVDYWRGLYGGAEIDDVLDRIGLGARAEAPARVLSQGQARRLALARLLVAPRPVWLLDEPAAGLDTQGKDLLARLIGEHCARGGVAIAAVHEPLGPAASQTITVGA